VSAGAARRAALATTAALAALFAAGCGGGSGGGGGKSEPPPGTAVFRDPTRIDNRWLPLRPGTRWVLEGSERGDGKTVPHRVVFLVTGLTKTVAGVRTVVVWDRDYDSGRLVEGELAFFAQDEAGNVWSYGEYPEEWEGKKVTGAPATWIPGIAGAAPGIMMQAEPRPGTPSYLQGSAPAIKFADRARVRSAGARTCVPAGCYGNVLVMEEWTPEEPGARQLKYYAPGVGNVRVGFTSGSQREGLALVKVDHLGPAALRRASAQALELDRRGYAVSPKVYGKTRPAVRGS
jgi:hypothetical protein